MAEALAISLSGLAANAAKLSTAATEIVRAFASRPEPSNPPPQPAPLASPATGSAAVPLAPSAATLGEGDAEKGFMDLIEARTAYRANLATMKTADDMAGAAIDMLG